MPPKPRSTTHNTQSRWIDLLWQLPDPLVCADIHGHIIAANPAAQALSGYSLSELLTLEHRDLLPLTAPADDRIGRLPPANIEESTEDVDSTTPAHREAWLRHKDGKLIPVLLSATPLVDPNHPDQVLELSLFKDIRSFKATERKLAEETQRYMLLFNSISDAVFLAPLSPEGTHGNFIEVNDAACARLGYTREEFMGMNARALNPPANVERTRAVGRSLQRDGESMFETIHVAKDGSHIPVEVTAGVIRIGEQEYVLSMARDLRELTHLRQAESRLGRLIDHSWEEIFIFDSESLRFLQANQGALTNLGYSKKELQQLRVTDIKPLIDEEEFRHLAQPLFDGTQNRVIFETEHQRKDGSTYPVEIRLQLSHSEVPPLFLANVLDITHRRKTEQRLAYLANFDALTGLPNRNVFLERLPVALTHSLRTDTLLAVLFLDLDGFKTINDTLGHHAGDQLLKDIAGRLQDSVRESDTVARLGGDEFTVILSNLRNAQDAEIVARKLIETVSQPARIVDQEVRVTTSIGITMYPFCDTDDTHVLIKQADAAMYQAKQLGKNSFQFYTASLMHAETRRLKMENALKLALERREFQIHYQPRVALSDSRIIGVEALLRWSRPEFGNVSPAEFVPIMETSGLIEEVGTWVLREACAQMRPLFELHDELRVSINVSARQFHGGQLAAVVAQAMEAAGVSPSRVEIEITEGVLITQTHEAAKTLRTLKGMGVNISLDDFGSGYSSLGYLKQFPIDCLKIDRSFIMDLPGRNDSKVIVEAILGLASSLDLRVTAEGIESAEQLAFLRTRGCQEGQGYLFARPMPLDDLIHKLSSSIYT